MLEPLKKFLALAPWEKRVLVSAWFLLGWKRAAILATDFKRQVTDLDHHRQSPVTEPVSQGQLHQARRIGYLVAVAARYTPWKSLCLVQVLVTQCLLQRRRIAGHFCLGVKKNAPLCASTEALAAHAWLECGGEVVNGASGREGYTVVSAFSWSAC